MDVLPETINNFLVQLFKKMESKHCMCDYRNARTVMKEMALTAGEKDEIMKYCKDNDGYCDCEILYNVPIIGGLKQLDLYDTFHYVNQGDGKHGNTLD